VFGTRGISAQHKNLMGDLRRLLPHSKKDPKLDEKDNLAAVNDICEMKSCNNCIFFETRKSCDLYLWVGKAPNGPTVKFHVQNIHTMSEMKMTGNCLLGSRPLLSFDKEFDTTPYYTLIKELFTQAFGAPKGHPKTKPFIDHILTFSICDRKIWFRNFQIVEDKNESKLVEIGPRFVLQLIRVFNGGFGGETLFQNTNFISPNEVRRYERKRTQSFIKRVDSTLSRKKRKQEPFVANEDYSEVFN